MRVQQCMVFEMYSLFIYRCHQSATNHLIKNHITAQHIIMNTLFHIIFSVSITIHIRLLTYPSKKEMLEL